MVSINQSLTPSNLSAFAALFAGYSAAARERADSEAARSNCDPEREADFGAGAAARRTGVRFNFSPGCVFTSMEDACTSLGLLKRAAGSKELLLLAAECCWPLLLPEPLALLATKLLNSEG